MSRARGHAAAPMGAFDIDYVSRTAWYGVVLIGAVALISWSPWGAQWAGVDFSRYVAGARGLLSSGDPYTGTGFVYSPAAALVMTPFTLVPFEIGLAIWRAAEVAALVLAVRGQPLAFAVFLFPWFWGFELIAGNMMGFALAAMVAVLRWPSIGTVVGYAALVAIVPKPALLPVLVWGYVMVPEARRYVVGLGALGLSMMLWPGYLDAALFGNDGANAQFHWPAWIVLVAIATTLAGLRYPRLLGPAGLFATPYVYPYALMPLGTLFVKARR